MLFYHLTNCKHWMFTQVSCSKAQLSFLNWGRLIVVLSTKNYQQPQQNTRPEIVRWGEVTCVFSSSQNTKTMAIATSWDNVNQKPEPLVGSDAGIYYFHEIVTHIWNTLRISESSVFIYHHFQTQLNFPVITHLCCRRVLPFQDFNTIKKRMKNPSISSIIP